MRILSFSVSLLITVFLLFSLNREWHIGDKTLPPIGSFMSPQQGFWQNAEPVDANFNENLKFPGLSGKANVYFDERMVPHVFASNENDAYFIQGYLHAKFRLWQMEFEVYAAAGRISELIGPKAINYDRDRRRLGMVYAAEIAEKEMEKNETTKAQCDSYTAGVNSYIASLKESELPVEYKLLNYKPEKWTNLKTALFLKYMSFELAGYEQDFEHTNAKTAFGLLDFAKIYPLAQDSLDPIVPKGTVYPKPALTVTAPASEDSLYLGMKDSVHFVSDKPHPENGSNNWAVSGKKTKSGKPILCNDPHLGLNLPSLWYEMQLSAPGLNAYGVSFPAAPGIIIGFNDSCAFGVTNSERDVRDYYKMKFRDESMKEYWFNGEWKQTEFRYEHIGVKGQAEIIDTVAYTVFGPVMYDKKYNAGRTDGGYYAVRWKAHDPSNELMAFNGLDHAKNYEDYLEAIKWMHTPGQNFVFASKNSGDIAIWAQGEFPAKWKWQGDFVMPGIDSSYMWQGNIPQNENPHQINPERGFVSSANQLPADPAAYPYYLGGSYPPYRGLIINRYLSHMNDITPEDMMKLQTENYNVFAEMAVPLFLKYMNLDSLSEQGKKYFDILKSWDFRNDVQEKGATVFALAWQYFANQCWHEDLSKSKLPMANPVASALLEAVINDSSLKFLHDIGTPEKETLQDLLSGSFKKASDTLQKIEDQGRLEWGKYKDTKVTHLAKLDAFSRLHLPIGGGTHCINAATSDHGPSWRMVVSLTDSTQAYGVYPGGQSGNPGSIYYDSFVDSWAIGKYYLLWMMKGTESGDSRIKFKMEFGN
ncbi:MAG: penicillin acylase family protein [Bacteroidetes bacterium]|nr:penicillin acylase family protein [Bacteroidota bacterium]